MIIRFGKYKGKTTEWLVLNDPAYTLWVHDEIACSLHDETGDLIHDFNHMPFDKKCDIQHCKKRAMESYVYSDSLHLY